MTQQAIWAHGATDDREQECEDEGYPNADSEPSLGWPETGSGRQSLVHTGAYYDREMDCEDEGAQCDDEGCTTIDDEPALGWTLDGNRGNSFDEDLEHDPADMGEPEDAF